MASLGHDHLSPSPPMAPLTADELQKHPEYDHTIWNLNPDHQGTACVAKDRGGPIDIAYEIHGHGPRRLVVSATLSYTPLPLHLRVPCSLGMLQTLSYPRLATWCLNPTCPSSTLCHVPFQSYPHPAFHLCLPITLPA